MHRRWSLVCVVIITLWETIFITALPVTLLEDAKAAEARLDNKDGYNGIPPPCAGAVDASCASVSQWATFARVWHVYDAAWQNPFASAALIKTYLMGLNKPIYHPMNDCGDHVVVINSKEIALCGEEWRKRVYFHHTGFPGGASWTLAWEMHEKDPTLILKKAVYRSMRGNLQRRSTMQRLHLFPNGNIPEEIFENVSNQIRQIRVVPKRFDSYTQEERENYPKIMDYPSDYILR